MKVEESRPSMEHTVENVESAGRQEVSDRVHEADVRKTLAAILQSPPFHGSKQSRELLQFIVDQTLAGRPEMLKERVIGSHVFGRRMDYATNDDPIVRARVAEVRKRLALYYVSAPGESLRISIPSGSFRASFEWAERNPAQLHSAPEHGADQGQPPAEPIAAPVPHEVAGQELPQSPSKSRWRRRWIVIAAAAVILTWAIHQYFASPYERAFNQFWSPVLDNPNTVLISIGKNPVYALSQTYIDAYNRQHPGSHNEGMEPYVPLPPGAKLDGNDLLLLDGTFVALSDVAATSKILSLMVLRKKQFDIRLGSDMTFGDLNEDPAILIGAYNNPWTLSMIENQRYVFSSRADIIDRSNTQKHWSPNADSTEDYAIVSRVLNSKTGKPILIAAGITGAGTRAAVGFITDPQAISTLAKSLPKGWEKKNIEVLLHASVTNGVPTAPDVVATYCW